MRILVADDDRDIARALYLRLAAAGFDVSVAHTGREALDLVTRCCPDLVILDIMMPDGNGFTVFDMLRTSRETGEIPVLFLTAHGNIPNWLYAMEHGASDVIQKPYDGTALVRTIRETLDRWYGPQTPRAA
ncbi:MAG: response regulator [Nitrospirae bacterium]|nr:response regulator [Nitrospirota bacterium]